MNEFPKYMNQGSNGPHVTLLQAFLIGAGMEGLDVVFDGNYGPVTAAKVTRFQKLHGLEADGHFGPDTRQKVRSLSRFDFDFEAACRAVPGVTKFVQPDGSIVEWGPDQSA